MACFVFLCGVERCAQGWGSTGERPDGLGLGTPARLSEPRFSPQ